jgi:hypothetical protein
MSSCATPNSLSSHAEQGHALELTAVDIPMTKPDRVPEGRYIFNNVEGWKSFWSRYHDAPRPEIDFLDHTLVVVFLGQKPNTGYSVEITSAKEYRDGIIIEMIEYLPLPGMMYAQVIVYPYRLNIALD